MQLSARGGSADGVPRLVMLDRWRRCWTETAQSDPENATPPSLSPRRRSDVAEVTYFIVQVGEHAQMGHYWPRQRTATLVESSVDGRPSPRTVSRRSPPSKLPRAAGPKPPPEPRSESPGEVDACAPYRRASQPLLIV